MSLKLMLERVAARYGDKTAIVSGDSRLSYSELDKASNKIAHALLEMGVKRGDRVATLLSNSPEFVATFFGIVKTGAIAVTLDPQYKPDELDILFNDCRPVVLVTEEPVLEQLVPVLSQFKSIKHIIDLSSGCGRPAPGGLERVFSSYREIMAAGPAERLEIAPESKDIALILYTSGPSLSPRGVMLSHRVLMKEARLMGDAFEQTDKDVAMLYALPMYHVFGLVAVLLTSIFRGSTVIMVPGTGLSIGSFMAAIEQEKGTIFFGVPYIFSLAVDLAEKEGIKNDLSSLRVCSSSADFMPVSLIKRFKELYGHKILDCFALTEAVCHVTCPSLNGSGKLGSVGRTLPGWEAKIVTDEHRELPPDQAGEIVLRGPFMTGYYNNPQATADVIKNGWLHTGDIGKVDEAGNLYITGRKKDIIIVKGQNIHPGDVEAVLFRHPEVAEAAVIGIPDEMRGEVVGAVISMKAGAAAAEPELRRWCSERLASYKVPKQFLFYSSLPRTATGQIDKESIRRKLAIPSPFKRVASQ